MLSNPSGSQVGSGEGEGGVTVKTRNDALAPGCRMD